MIPTMFSPGQQPESLDIQLLVDSIPALIHTARPDGYVDYFNKPWLEYLGATLDDLTGWKWSAFIHPQDVDGIVAKWRACIATGEIFEYETRVRRANGEYRWMFHRKVPLRAANGNILKWYGSSRDIDERDTAEERLRRNAEELQRSEFYLAEGQRLAHTGSWAFDSDGFNYWSPELFRIHGLDPASKPPTVQEYLDRVHPDDRGSMADLIEGILVKASSFDATKRFIRPNGEVRYIRCVGAAVLENQSLKKYVGSAIDVTEHELLTQEVLRREAYLAEAQKLSHTGSWAWNPATGEPGYWSEECYRVLGFDPAGPLPLLETIFQRIQPDDARAAIREQFHRGIRDKTDFQLDFDFVHPTRGIRNIRSTGHAVVDTHGNLREMVGTVIDVTERKRAEEEWRRLEMEVQQILDFTPQHVAVLGPRQERIFASPALLNYFGLRLEEWQSRDTQTRVHPDDWESFREFRAAGVLEARLRRFDGKYRWFLVRNNPLHDEQGQIRRWYIAGTDIEDRKQAEERLRQENVALREEIDKTSMFEEIVGTSPALKIVLSRISKVASSNATVLITGETGTGKELVARAIHRRSNRASCAFVTVNCAAIPTELIASELFGHEKGAFTGATQQRLGRFELANGGTLFLDEVGELPAETQIALLRVLQEREFERVGGTRRIRADVRVIAATNRDLQAAISAGSFRSDLFYRLHVFPLEVPPLRGRKEDIHLLVDYFVDRYARKAGKRITTVDKKTLRLLESYPWPGNIRELQNVIERSVIVCETESFSVDESWLSQQPPERKAESQLDLSEKVAAQEKGIIEAALRECRGRVSGPSGAAANLGIARSTLESKIRSLKINKNRYRT